jgi:phosphatidylserine/phosphatidylglycerophosphate/cardiolipin synthase-like enzyme
VLSAFLAECTAAPVDTPAVPVASQPATQVCFVPGPVDCALQAVAQIDLAQHTLDMQSYNFTEPHIAAALIQAHARGVTVRLISDKTGPSEKGGQTEAVAKAGIPVWIDYEPRIAHNKVMVIDGVTVLTGSFNWTTSADQHNAENLLVLHDAQLAAQYEANFASRLADSETLAAYESDR